MAAVRRELAEEEAAQYRPQNVTAQSAGHTRMSAGVMVAAGIELEEQQYVHLCLTGRAETHKCAQTAATA